MNRFFKLVTAVLCVTGLMACGGSTTSPSVDLADLDQFDPGKAPLAAPDVMAVGGGHGDVESSLRPADFAMDERLDKLGNIQASGHKRPPYSAR